MAASSGLLANDTDILAMRLDLPARERPLPRDPDPQRGRFLYLHAVPDYSGRDSFTYQALDGTASSNTATTTLSVTWVNQPPVGASNAVTIVQNTPYTFQASDFGFTDPADTPPDGFLGVKISELPSAGALWNGDQKVNAGDTISVDDINKGLLTFAPDADTYGQDYAAFSFQVQDDGGTANGGIDLDQTPRTFTMNVIAPPVVVDESYSTSNDTPLTIAAPGILGEAADVYGNTLTASLVSGPAYGQLVFNSDGSFTYTPLPRWAGSDAFTYRAYDGISYSNTATIDLAVVSEDQAPVATNRHTRPARIRSSPSRAPACSPARRTPRRSVMASIVSGPAHGVLTPNPTATAPSPTCPRRAIAEPTALPT